MCVFALFFQVGYPVLTLDGDGGTSQTRFLALAGEGEKDETTWTIPAKVVWEGGGELVVMLEGEGGGGGGDRKLKEKLQELQTAGKWFKVSVFLFFFPKTSKIK